MFTRMVLTNSHRPGEELLILAIFQSHLAKNGGGDAREKIDEFLDKEDFENVILNSGIDQRVILVAAHFRREVTSTVL